MTSMNRCALLAAALALASCNRNYYNECPVVEETFVHRYGMEVPECQWNASGAHGQVISTLKNGVVVTKTYDTGNLHGQTSYTFPHNAAIQKIEDYDRGVLTKETIFYLSGLPQQETLFSEKGKIINTWYEAGSPKSREEYNNDYLVKGEYYSPEHQLETVVENGSGTRTRRDSYGLLVSVDKITNGHLALSSTFHPNGSPKEITPYRNDFIEGERKTFFPAGEPNTIETWVAGNQQGMTISFQNGEKVAEIPYKKGLKNGIERHFRDGDKLVEEITWVDGKKHGPCRTFLGNTINTDWYFQNQPVNKGTFDLMSDPMNR